MKQLRRPQQRIFKSNGGRFCNKMFRFWYLSLIFIALYLLYISLTWPSLTPSVLPHDEKQDIFVRSTGPRVVIFVFSDKTDETLCYSVGSAYLSGFPVVVAGYQMPYLGFLSKFDFMKTAIQNAELEPQDVIIVIDSDVIFTGADINPFLDRFIAQSAATPEELDVLAVRQGRAMAPFTVTGEIACFAPNVFSKFGECRVIFQDFYRKVRKYVITHPEHNLSLDFSLSPQHHLNSGSVIARVWAYKEFLHKAVNLTQTQRPRSGVEKWNCDQSIYIALFLNLITWEVERDVFSMSLHERAAVRSPYGVRGGFIGLDYINAFAFSSLAAVRYTSYMHEEHWAKYLPSHGPEHPFKQEMTDFESIGRFVGDIHRRAYAAHGNRIYTNVSAPRWVSGKRAPGKSYIHLTPPLLVLKPRPIDEVGNTMHHTYPLLFHSPGVKPGFTKVNLLEYGAICARWFLPIAHNRQVRREAIRYLKSAPLFLSTNNYIIRDSYDAKCGFPFDRTIKIAKIL